MYSRAWDNFERAEASPCMRWRPPLPLSLASLLSTGLEGEDPIGCHHHLSDIGGRNPPSAGETAQVGIGRPTGNRAGLSNVKLDALGRGLCEKLAERRHTNASHAVYGS